MEPIPITISDVRASSLRHLIGVILPIAPIAYLFSTGNYVFAGGALATIYIASGPIGALIIRFDRTRVRDAYATIDDESIRFGSERIRWSELTHAREYTTRSGLAVLIAQTHRIRIIIENPKQGPQSEEPYWTIRDRIPIEIGLSVERAGFGPAWYHQLVRHLTPSRNRWQRRR